MVRLRLIHLLGPNACTHETFGSGFSSAHGRVFLHESRRASIEPERTLPEHDAMSKLLISKHLDLDGQFRFVKVTQS